MAFERTNRSAAQRNANPLDAQALWSTGGEPLRVGRHLLQSYSDPREAKSKLFYATSTKRMWGCLQNRAPLINRTRSSPKKRRPNSATHSSPKRRRKLRRGAKV